MLVFTRSILTTMTLTFFGVALIAHSSEAAPFTLTATINNPTPNVMDRFGHDIAISGSTLLAGSVFDDQFGLTDPGRAYVFDVNTGALTRAINNPFPNTGDHFSVSLDLDGNVAVIGSHFDDVGSVDRAGRVHIFDVTTGTRLRTISNPEASPDDFFGDASAISGNNVLVGARNGDAGGGNVGGAYLFDVISGSLLHTFNNPNPSSGDFFGFNLDIDGNVIAVSAEREDTGASNSGAVYLFDAVTGAQTHALFNPNPGVSDIFGSSIKVFGDRVLVGAQGDDSSGADSGIAYLYDANTGALTHTFTNPTPAVSDAFGVNLDLNNDFVVISAGGDDTAGLNAGAAYVFDAVNFNLLQTIKNPAPGNTFFGSGSGGNKIALGDGFLAISNATSNDSGVTYVYQAGVPTGGTISLLFIGTILFGSFKLNKIKVKAEHA